MEGLVELVVDKYDGSLKAEHGTGLNMAPYVEREWGAKATELMWRVKRAGRPRRRARPRGRAQRRPRRPPAEPEDDAADRGGGDDLRRVRVLRAGLPEPQPDDDAAPADRPAPRDGAPGAGLAGAAGAARASSSTTRSRPAPPTGPACSPARWGSTPGKLIKGLRARAAHRSRASGSALRLAGRWEAVERARAPRPRAPATAAGSRAPRCAARAGPRAAPSATSSSPSGRANMPPAGAGRAAATTPRDGAAAVYMPACVNRIFGRARRTRTGPSLARGAGRRLRARRPAASGSRRTSPATAARRRGRRRATRPGPGGWPTTPSTRCGAGATAASCRSSSTRARARSGSPTRRCALLSEINAERHAKLEILDSIAWAHERLLPRLEIDAQARLGRRAPALREPPPRARRRRSRRSPARSPTRSSCRSPRPAAASPATAGCCTPSCRRRRRADEAAELDGRELRRPRLLATAPARSASSRGPGRPTSRSCSRSRS